MALPNKKIKKIKLPGDVEGNKTYEIVPDKLSDGSTNFSATLPTLTEDSTIALASDIPDDSNLVHKTGDETIAGAKTFNNNLSINGNLNITQYDSIPLNIAGDGSNDPLISINTDSSDSSNTYYIGVENAYAGAISLTLPAKTGTIALTSDFVASTTGTAITEAKYITINGTEWKLGGSIKVVDLRS